MTPVQARGLLIALDRNPGSVVSTPTAKHALRTIAAAIHAEQEQDNV